MFTYPQKYMRAEEDLLVLAGEAQKKRGAFRSAPYVMLMPQSMK